MTTTANRRRKVSMPHSIRKKLSAALCMLLVATIMMVSSTYAWFTLSTAPEVTGITTNVGANGNLEIALLNRTSFASVADDLGIASNVGDSMANANTSTEDANATWGNLVDLSPLSYGLNKIVLSPSALNVTDLTEKVVDRTILKAPTYGSDGRVITVDKETVTGLASGTSFTVSDTDYGVRAIGVSSGLTLRASTYRNALSSISVNMTSAQNAARRSLSENGPDLAAILVKVAGSSDTSSVTLSKSDVQVLGNVLSALNDANGYVFTALKNAVLADVMSSHSPEEMTDETVSALATAISGATPETLTNAASGASGYSMDSDILAAIGKYTALNDAITTAQTNYNALDVEAAQANATYTWEQIDDILNAIVNPTYVKVAGVKDGDPMTYGGKATYKEAVMAAVISAITGADRSVPIEMLEDSGVYYSIAELAGRVTAQVTATINTADFGQSLGVIPVTANMYTPDDLSALLGGIVSNMAVLPETLSGATSIDDTYGYVLDFGVRTNASGSNLLLQIAGKQRVYNGETNTSTAESTQGAGSFVEFKTANPTTFSIDEMRALLSAMRIVFVEPDNSSGSLAYKIIAMAAPDITKTTANNVDTYTGGTASGEDTLKVDLALYNFTVAADASNADNAPILTLGTKIVDDADTADLDESTLLTALEQNVAKKISVIVYLDGDIVDNTMVANAKTSMSGKLNLQFASDAALVPMQNTALFNYDGTGTGTGSETPTIPENITKEQLSAAIDEIKADSIYTTAVAAAEPTAEQTALLDAVTVAVSVVNDGDPTQEEITNAATTLGAAYLAAGGTNPFSGS